jgi:hypothetical protein
MKGGLKIILSPLIAIVHQIMEIVDWIERLSNNWAFKLLFGHEVEVHMGTPLKNPAPFTGSGKPYIGANDVNLPTGGRGATSSVEHKHSGTVTVRGVNDKDQLVAVANLTMENVLKELDRGNRTQTLRLV